MQPFPSPSDREWEMGRTTRFVLPLHTRTKQNRTLRQATTKKIFQMVDYVTHIRNMFSMAVLRYSFSQPSISKLASYES